MHMLTCHVHQLRDTNSRGMDALRIDDSQLPRLPAFFSLGDAFARPGRARSRNSSRRELSYEQVGFLLGGSTLLGYYEFFCWMDLTCKVLKSLMFC